MHRNCSRQHFRLLRSVVTSSLDCSLLFLDLVLDNRTVTLRSKALMQNLALFPTRRHYDMIVVVLSVHDSRGGHGILLHSPALHLGKTDRLLISMVVEFRTKTKVCRILLVSVYAWDSGDLVDVLDQLEHSLLRLRMGQLGFVLVKTLVESLADMSEVVMMVSPVM